MKVALVLRKTLRPKVLPAPFIYYHFIANKRTRHFFFTLIAYASSRGKNVFFLFFLFIEPPKHLRKGLRGTLP